MRVRWNPECRMFKNWLRKNNGVYFTLQMICSELRLPDGDVDKLYQCVLYWRRKFKEYYEASDKVGILQGDSYQKWLIALTNFERHWDIQPFYYDRGMEQYYVPNLADKEEISRQRLVHWIKSGQTVVSEMAVFGEKMVLTGKKPDEIFGDLKMIEEKIMDGSDVLRCPTCGQNIQDNWVRCPSCGQHL